MQYLWQIASFVDNEKTPKMFKIPLVFSFTEKYQPLKYEAFKKAKENCVHLLNILTSLAGNDLSFLINKNKEALKPPESLAPKEKELFL